MPSTGGETSSGNAILTHQVTTGWALRDGTGVAFFDPEQESKARHYEDKPGVVTLYRPAKELLAELKERVPVVQDGETEGA